MNTILASTNSPEAFVAVLITSDNLFHITPSHLTFYRHWNTAWSDFKKWGVKEDSHILRLTTANHCVHVQQEVTWYMKKKRNPSNGWPAAAMQ